LLNAIAANPSINLGAFAPRVPTMQETQNTMQQSFIILNPKSIAIGLCFGSRNENGYRRVPHTYYS
jgi:hypothetical protein